MMRRRCSIATALVAAVVAAVVSPRAALAQQIAAGGSASSSAARAARTIPQGFSVVLVVGDLQGPSGEEDVPPAARRALADMKDFLPYKSFKLVDAAWIMGTTHAVNRLRGPDDREYELEITVTDGRQPRLAGTGLTSGASDSRIGVVFSLREPSAREATGSSGGGARGDESSVAFLEAQIEELRGQVRDARAKYNGSHPEVVRLNEQLSTLMAKRQDAQRQVEQRRMTGSGTTVRSSGRMVMNTSFSMDVGETVVVGTSRLSGNSKALIALLTAVAPKSPRR